MIMTGLLLSCLALGCNRQNNPGVPQTVVTRTTTTRTTVPPPADSPMGQLIAFLQSKGFAGEYVALPGGKVDGAGERGSFQGKGFGVTFYRFADPNLASSTAATGINDRKCYANGPFVMEVGMADEGLVNAFLAYQ